MRPSDPLEGRVLAKRYRLMEKLGEGGMGCVWRAEHLLLQTHVAIKLIDPYFVDCSEALIRFQREARAAAAIHSVNVVQIMDYGVDDDVPYIAMELLEGEPLSARLNRIRKMPPGDVGDMLYQVARGLNRAHEKGIVHRDLKPANIYIVNEGSDEIVKVLDFGIAKRFGELQSTTGGFQTKMGVLIGTPHYVSPEQAIGSGNIDFRSDIWAFGVIAFECMTGKKPFQGDTLGALLMAICHQPLPVPSKLTTVPVGFDGWFARAAARNPDERFESIMDAITYLRVVCKLASTRPPAPYNAT